MRHEGEIFSTAKKMPLLAVPVCRSFLAVAGVAIGAGGLGLAVYNSTKKPPSTSPSKKQLQAALTADEKQLADLKASMQQDAQSQTDWTPIILAGAGVGVVLLVVLVASKKGK